MADMVYYCLCRACRAEEIAATVERRGEFFAAHDGPAHEPVTRSLRVPSRRGTVSDGIDPTLGPIGGHGDEGPRGDGPAGGERGRWGAPRPD